MKFSKNKFTNTNSTDAQINSFIKQHGKFLDTNIFDMKQLRSRLIYAIHPYGAFQIGQGGVEVILPNKKSYLMDKDKWEILEKLLLQKDSETSNE